MNDTFECDGCGACCRTKLVNLYEVGLLREPTIKPHTMTVREPGIDGQIGYLNCLRDRACQFLDGANRCGIYPTRPSVCVAFLAGSEECQEARQALGLPPLEPIAVPQS